MCVSDDPPVCLFLKHDANLIFESRRAFVTFERVVAFIFACLYAPGAGFYQSGVVGVVKHNIVILT